MSASDVGSGALAGGATGATIGTAVLPGWGTAIGGAIGAVGGGLVGWFNGAQRDDAAKAQQRAVENARAQLQELAVKQRAQREADLQRALSYFAPVHAEMGRLYGTPASGSAPPRPSAPSPMSPAPVQKLPADPSMTKAAPYFGRRH